MMLSMPQKSKDDNWFHAIMLRAMKEFETWTPFHLLFELAVTGVVGVLVSFFAAMPWPTLILLLVFVFLAVFSGTILYRRAVREMRQPMTNEDRAAKLESRRRHEARKLFQELIDEADEGMNWDSYHVNSWIARAECTIEPLLSSDDVNTFRNLFHDTNSLSDEKRQRCVAWLKSACVKYWLGAR